MPDFARWRETYAHDVLGSSPKLTQALQFVRRIAGSDSSVLLTGETGTGKEVFARTIHRSSARSARPFIAVNCAAIPDSLIEAELFGYVKGAFTGAANARAGKFAAAHGGTLFLDEIGDLPLAAQAKLLRVLEEKAICPVGADHELLITGPSDAKLGLIKHIHAHHAALVPNIVGVETVDHPTDGQIVAYAKKYFRAADRMR